MPHDWRVAKSLVTLLGQVNELCPNRHKDWDGTIGDEKHQQSKSDHNPDSHRVVCAMDITHDPQNGFDSYKFADFLKSKHDRRIQYLISNGRIWNRDVHPETWRPYTGASPHDHHVHISVDHDPALADDNRPWDLSGWKTGPKPQVAFHSLMPGGIYSDIPYDRSVPTSIRTNNPGALNASDWVKACPGYVSSDETSPGNFTAIFQSPEEGVMAWWDLMQRYRAAGVVTVGDIIDRYGGGQDYSAYVDFVSARTQLSPDHEVKLEGDDQNLLEFAKAMFRYEGGVDTPLSDEQIMLGFRLARET